jgi:hypothetical protein
MSSWWVPTDVGGWVVVVGLWLALLGAVMWGVGRIFPRR